MCTTQKLVTWLQGGIFHLSEVCAILGDQEIRLYGLIFKQHVENMCQPVSKSHFNWLSAQLIAQ